MSFDLDRLGDMLVCPESHSPMVLHSDMLVSVSPSCRRAYHVVDGIPRLLVSDSAQLSPDEWGEIMSQHGRDSISGAALSKSATN